MLANRLLQCAAIPSGEEPTGAIDFDGVNDYLSRSSDLVGNADGKTFTFSAWVWRNALGVNQDLYYSFESAYGLRVYQTTGDLLYIRANSSAGTEIFAANVTVPTQIKDTFLHVLISIDLANTSNRYVYVNDVVATVTWATYSNAIIDFTKSSHQVGAALKGRLAHVFLDYTYRDLSVEANRRLFITADRKPALNQQALNPILYLPLSDPTQPGKNLGTGGDFALTGVVARSGRGPNQFNAVYSDLDGAADYLSRTSITGIADGKVFTFSCVFNTDNRAGPSIFFGSGSGTVFKVQMSLGVIQVAAWGTAGTICLNASTTAFIANGRNHVVTVSMDMSSTATRAIYVDGLAASVTWETYVNTTIDFTRTFYGVGAGNGDSYLDGRLGNVFFDTKYIDLSVPANLAKFVTGTGIDAKPVDLGANGELPFGTAPLIYLPMYGNNAGKNYGTGGDFTVNSGPYPGARGPNEFWGNKADFDGSTGYLARTSALTGVSNGKIFSTSFSFSIDAQGSHRALFAVDSDSTFKFRIGVTNSNQLVIETDSNEIQAIATTTTIAAATDYFVQVCIDLSNTSKRFIYINGVLQSVAWNLYGNLNIAFASANPKFGYETQYTWRHDGKLSEFYFTTDYIDFSQEANRLLFRDAFGNPVALLPQIEAGTIPNPAIYMRFDPADQGRNDGTGGNFTKSGTINDGGQL